VGIRYVKARKERLREVIRLIDEVPNRNLLVKRIDLTSVSLEDE
jgi:hypothetical protein